MTGWCSEFDDSKYVNQFFQLNMRDPVLIKHLRVHWNEPKQDFGSRCAPVAFQVRIQEIKANGNSSWTTIYNKTVPAHCRLKNKCSQYPNRHNYNVRSWTVTEIINDRNCKIRSVLIAVSRFAIGWATCTISRVEALGPPIQQQDGAPSSEVVVPILADARVCSTEPTVTRTGMTVRRSTRQRKKNIRFTGSTVATSCISSQLPRHPVIQAQPAAVPIDQSTMVAGTHLDSTEDSKTAIAALLIHMMDA
jgi:hypothetical protein